MIKKSVLLTALAIAGFAVTSLAQTVPNYVPSNGLVGWWPFNGNAIDESVNTNDGTVNGATLTTDRFGNASSAYSFNGTNNFIEIPDAPSLRLNNTDFTISFWVNVNTFSNGSNATAFLCKRGSGSNNGWIIDANTSAFGYQVSSGTNPNVYSNTIISTNVWHNLIVRYSIATQNIAFYYDGVLNVASSTILPTPNSNTSSVLRFGYDTYSPPNPYWLNGKLDDIGIWNRALTQQEITGLYNANLCFQTITVTDTLLINTNITGFNPVTYQNTIKIWPNPTNDHITIDNGNLANLTGHQIKISNALGQQVFQSAITQQQFYVDMSTWGGNGIYFVNLINAQGVTIETRKIVLQ